MGEGMEREIIIVDLSGSNIQSKSVDSIIQLLNCDRSVAAIAFCAV